MKNKEMLHLFDNVRDQYVMEAMESRTAVRRSPRRLMLAAAVVALLAALGCGVAYAESLGWFEGFFTQRSEKPLTTGQLQEIADREVLIQESVTQDDWTVELGSVMSDGDVGYILLHVTAPEDVSLEDTLESNGDIASRVFPGNGGMLGGEPGMQEILQPSKKLGLSSYSMTWEEDGDGLDNTRNFVITIDPSLDPDAKLFAPDVDWHICLQGFGRESWDEAYREELRSGKYQGQTDVIFEPEEVEAMLLVDTLTDSCWEFDVNFADGGEKKYVELLEAPISVTADVTRRTGEGIWDVDIFQEKITITSFRLGALTSTVYFECSGVPSLYVNGTWVKAVMKDGSTISMEMASSSRAGYLTLVSAAPIVAEDVDHILMPDGTKLPMPG